MNERTPIADSGLVSDDVAATLAEAGVRTVGELIRRLLDNVDAAAVQFGMTGPDAWDVLERALAALPQQERSRLLGEPAPPVARAPKKPAAPTEAVRTSSDGYPMIALMDVHYKAKGVPAFRDVVGQPGFLASHFGVPGVEYDTTWTYRPLYMHTRGGVETYRIQVVIADTEAHRALEADRRILIIIPVGHALPESGGAGLA